MERLQGKVALVTGAARGAGAEIARRFAREGAQVVLGDVLDDLGGAVADEIGDAARYLHLDVTSRDDWQRALALAHDCFGPVGVLVNNAAVLDVSSIAETRYEDLRRIVEVNQIGPFLGIQAVLPDMRSRGGGSIVNVASIDAIEGSNGVAAYTSSKWGLRGLTKAAAVELGRLGIRVNNVCPGFGSREMVEPFFARAAERLARTRERIPDRPQHPFTRRGELPDVAAAIVWLASDESGYVSGIDLTVDGAFTAGKIEPAAPFS